MPSRHRKPRHRTARHRKSQSGGVNTIPFVIRIRDIGDYDTDDLMTGSTTEENVHDAIVEHLYYNELLTHAFEMHMEEHLPTFAELCDLLHMDASYACEARAFINNEWQTIPNVLLGLYNNIRSNEHFINVYGEA